MKTLLIIILLITLSGCGVINLNNFVLPDDIQFINLIQELDTPEKIGDYMVDNFTLEAHPYYNLSPYELWQIQKGDCNDFRTFTCFIAEYHNYETYYILIYYKDLSVSHILGVFLENSKYTYSNFMFYNPIYASSFSEIVSHFFANCDYKFKSYKVYDYDMNLIEKVNNYL